MGTILAQSAFATSMLLSASVPPIIMETNFVCRNIDQVANFFGCPPLIYRRLDDDSQAFSTHTMFQNFKAARAALAWAGEGHPRFDGNRTRRLFDLAPDVGTMGSTESQLLERIAASKNEDVCTILEDLCKLPIGVESMTYACTCNGKSAGELVGNSQQ